MISYDAAKTRLNRVFTEVFDDDSILLRDEMTAEDIDEWDSLSHITLVLAAEREFGVAFSAKEVGALENVGAMIRVIMVRAAR